MPTTSKPETTEVQTAQAVDPVAICSALVEVAANAMQTKVRDAHVIRINAGPWLDFEETHNLGKSLGFGGYLNLLEWLVEKYGVPFKGVVHWPNVKV
jgi:hypothetical protein